MKHHTLNPLMRGGTRTTLTNSEMVERWKLDQSMTNIPGNEGRGLEVELPVGPSPENLDNRCCRDTELLRNLANPHTVSAPTRNFVTTKSHSDFVLHNAIIRFL